MEQCKKITIQSFQAITQYSCCVRPFSELHQLSEYIMRFNVQFTLNAYGFIRYFAKGDLYYSTRFFYNYYYRFQPVITLAQEWENT